jgi:hypothetical protein
MRITLAILFLLLISVSSFAQSRKQRKAEAAQQGNPTSLDPSPQEEKRTLPKHVRKKAESKGPTYNNEREYYERVEALGKTRRKNEKMLMTPQYSDPTYFGHKRPPKKRPPHKMKFCKECGIRH